MKFLLDPQFTIMTSHLQNAKTCIFLIFFVVFEVFKCKMTNKEIIGVDKPTQY